MATYKVPQDVEADDKLLGPFSFKQFIFLLIAVGLGALAYFLGSILLPLFIIPTPFAIFFLVLALPLRKDQPMETYVAAIISFHIKPRKKIWNSDGVINNIEFNNSVIEKDNFDTNLSYEEAHQRLSFLSNIIDSQGQSINQISNIKPDVISESRQIEDVQDNYNETAQNFDKMIQNQKNEIKNNYINNNIQKNHNDFKIPEQIPTEKNIINDLANDNILSIKTISSEFKRRKEKTLIDESESNISLRN